MRKRTLKGIVCLIVLAAAALGAAAVFTACGEPAALDKVTNVKFDFETGDYSFTGVADASEYRVRIFPIEEDENGGETDGELPINESNAIRGGRDSYSGNVPLWSLTPGAEYNVYVLAISGEDGVENSTSDAVRGTYIAVYETVDSGVTATISGTTVTVELGTDAISDYYDSGADFKVTLYAGDAESESKTLKNADIEKEESSGGFPGFPGGGPGGFPGFGGGAEYSASVTFDVADAAEYSVTVTVVSTNAPAYKNSAESERFAVTAASETPTEPGGDNPAPVA